MKPTAALAARPGLAAGLAYAVLAVLLVSPGLLPGRTLSASDWLWSAAPWQGSAPRGVRPLGANYELADSVTQFEPFLRYARERLPAPPLWNPYLAAGRPFLANAQSAVFSPFSWPAFVLPFWWSLAWIAALKLWVAAFGTFALARALGQGAAGALLAGLAFGFGLWFVTWLSWPLDSVWAWLPWLLLAVDAVVRRPGARPVAALAVVVALQFFGGHPESSFHVLVAGALFAALRRPSRVAAVRLAAGAAAGGALAAVALLPFAELLAHSADLAARGDRAPVSVAPKYILGLATPEYWGRPTKTILEPFVNARAWYVGALPLLLAGLALVRPTRERVAIAAAAVVALLVATGVQPLFWLAHHVPGLAQAHNTRLGVFVALGLALLAGWGLEDLRERRPPRAALVASAALAALPLVAAAVNGRVHDPGRALAAAWGFATPAADVVPFAAVLVWLPLAAAALALVWTRPRALVPLALALVALDLARAGAGQNPAIPVARADPPATGAIRYLRSRRPQRFVGVARAAVLAPVPPDVAMRYGLLDARAYDYPVVKAYADLWSRDVAKPDPFLLTPAGATATATPRALRALGRLAVGDVLTPPGDPPPPGTRLVYAGRDAKVYANPFARPRASIAGGRAVLVADAPEATTVRTDAPAGTLVLADVDVPGWRATVDGRGVPVRRVDGLLRGVDVPAGRHVVALRYRPWSFTAGWLVSLAAAAGLAAAVWKSPRRCAR